MFRCRRVCRVKKGTGVGCKPRRDSRVDSRAGAIGVNSRVFVASEYSPAWTSERATCGRLAVLSENARRLDL